MRHRNSRVGVVLENEQGKEGIGSRLALWKEHVCDKMPLRELVTGFHWLLGKKSRKREIIMTGDGDPEQSYPKQIAFVVSRSLTFIMMIIIFETFHLVFPDS